MAPVARPPLRPWLAGLGLVALAGVEALLVRSMGLDACLFKEVTGWPCPTCGTTRGVLALLAGHPLQALAWNPLVFGGIVAGAGLAAIRWLRGRPWGWVGRHRRLAWLLAAAALLANWIYLVARGV